MGHKFYLPLTLILVGYAYGAIVYENVIFQKVNEITTTRARWLVTFVQDLSPFKYFLAHVSTDIDKVAEVTDAILVHYNDSRPNFQSTLVNLKEEVNSLDKTLEGILQSYTTYRTLGSGSRSRRSLFPMVGRIMSFMFGTISQAEIDDVRNGINQLSRNQQSIIHVLDEQISILNVSRTQIAENRNAIIDLVKCVNLFDARLRKFEEAVQRRFEHVEMFINLYSQMDLLLSGIRDTIQRAVLYLENLRLELNMLSLNHLSPSTITPNELQSLLIQIKTKLPSSLKLPENPETNIWYFYGTLTCNTILENDKIIVMINIPLLDYNGEFDVFQAHSIPVPLHQNKSSELPDMVAKYNIEYSGLLINKDRSQYALLTPEELHTCGNTAIKYCSPKNVILPVNLHQLCLLALFFKDHSKVDKHCRKTVEPNAVLPMATYISSGHWLVSARTPLEFSIVCLAANGRSSSMTQTIQKMSNIVDIITLKSGCHAANDFLNLPPYYEYEQQIHVPDPLNNLLTIRNKTKFRVWDSFEKLPTFPAIELPENLKSIKQIPMDHLVTQLRGLGRVEVKNTSWPIWVHILINLGIILVVVVLLYCCCIVRKNKSKWTPNENSCLRSLANICKVGGRSDEGEPNQRRRSTGDEGGLAMSTLLKDEEDLTCRPTSHNDAQSSLLGQLRVSPTKTGK